MHVVIKDFYVSKFKYKGYFSYDFVLSEEVQNITYVFVPYYNDYAIYYNNSLCEKEELISRWRHLDFFIIRKLDGTVLHCVIDYTVKYLIIKPGLEIDAFFVGEEDLYYIMDNKYWKNIPGYGFKDGTKILSYNDFCINKCADIDSDALNFLTEMYEKNVFNIFEKTFTFLLCQNAFVKTKKVSKIPKRLFANIWSEYIKPAKPKFL